MTELWRPVVGYEGMYEVSNLGNVRGLPRVIKRCKCGEPIRRARGGPLKWIMRIEGYPLVSLSRGNRYVQRLVHRLVLEAFVGPAPKGMEACHKNGKQHDPRLVNLRWDTKKANHADKWLHGTMLVGEETNSVKLREEQVKEIFFSSEPISVLAHRFGVGRSAISRIQSGETWKHLRLDREAA